MDRRTCLPDEPLIKMGGGEAPTLDYNLPQSTAITAYGLIPVEFRTAQFKQAAFERPDDQFLGQFKDPTTEGIAADLKRKLADGRPLAGITAPSSFGGSARSGTANRRSGGGLGPGNTGTSDQSGRPSDEEVVRAAFENTDPEDLAEAILMGARPVVRRMLSGKQVSYMVIPTPRARPGIYILEEYRISSWLRDYGAGRTVSTFTLLPGEKTTITLRTYRDMESTRSVSENVLDSFTEASADEFERLVEEEKGVNVSGSLSGSRNSSLGLSASVPVGGGASAGGSASTSSSISATMARASNSRTLERALEKHVQTSSRTREVEVNVSMSVALSTGEERTVTRELVNINRSRVLNFVFRQLLQEYTTLVWLNDIRFVFTNGDPASTVVVDLPRLEAFLQTYLRPDEIEGALAALLKDYCKVFNYDDERFTFIERHEESYGDCPFAAEGETVEYWRKRKDLKDEFDGIEVPGVIMEASTQVLPTSSIIGEALLGQGEALDCYNMSLQDAAVQSADLRNRRLETALVVIDAVEAPMEQAEAFDLIFGGSKPSSEVDSGVSSEGSDVDA